MKKLICALLAVLLLVGCSSVSTPSKAAEKLIKEVQNKKSDLMKNEDLDLSSLSKANRKIAEKVIDMVLDFDYKILDEKIDGDKAIIDVKITTYNFVSAVPSLVTSILGLAFQSIGSSEQQIEDKMFEIVDEQLTALKKEGKKYSYNIKLPAVKNGKNWEVSVDAATQILLEPFADMLEAYSGLLQ